MITSCLDYCNSVFAGLPAIIDFNGLPAGLITWSQQVQNNAAQLVMKKKKERERLWNTSPHFTGCLWNFTVRVRLWLWPTATLMGLYPLIFLHPSASRSLRASKEKPLKIPKPNLKYFCECAFSLMVLAIWNSLLASLRNFQTLSQFISHLKPSFSSKLFNWIKYFWQQMMCLCMVCQVRKDAYKWERWEGEMERKKEGSYWGQWWFCILAGGSVLGGGWVGCHVFTDCNVYKWKNDWYTCTCASLCVCTHISCFCVCMWVCVCGVVVVVVLALMHIYIKIDARCLVFKYLILQIFACMLGFHLDSCNIKLEIWDKTKPLIKNGGGGGMEANLNPNWPSMCLNLAINR